jgi:Ni/Co efflux regulator RcnB
MVMRKILISILLASAAASPALAQDHGDGRGHHDQEQSDRSQAREERQQQREQARSERSGGGANSERSQPQLRTERTMPQVEGRQQQPVQVQVQDAQHGSFDRSRFERGSSGPRVVEAPQDAERGTRGNWGRDRGQTSDRSNWSGDRTQRSDGPSGWTRTQNGWTRGSGDLRRGDRPVPNVMRTRNPLVVSGTPREGTQPPLRTEHRRWSSSNWNTNWRHDGRYDWRNWRDRHRSLFHIGIYYDPFGWDYQSYQVGWRLWPGYYGRQYWIDDPYQYRLPYAPPGTTWIRYWDDALLVDTWTGEVVDVIHNFFW